MKLLELTPNNIQAFYDEIDAAEVAANAEQIMGIIASTIKNAIAKDLKCPRDVCLNSPGVFSVRSAIHPKNLRTLLDNGFKVYRVRFLRNNYFKEHISWCDNFYREVYLPLYAQHGMEPSDFVEVTS